jgi:flagellar biosynthesis/type III secretory pathway protein FliH
LPEDLEARFHEQLYEYERKKSMPYVTSAERFGIAKGRQQGIEEGLQQGIEKGLQQGIEKGLQRGIEEGQVIAGRQDVLELLEVRFGSVPEEVRERVNAETDRERLRQWHRLVAICPTLEDLRLG